MNNFKYELKYICDGVETVVTSPADITVHQMKELLIQFCRCSGWSDSQINTMIVEDVDTD